MEENEQIKSKYSSGINIILRLDQLWKDTHLHSRNDLFYKWNNDLDCIWRELARDIKDNEYVDKKKGFDGFDTEIKKVGNFQDQTPNGFKKPDSDFWKKRDEHYKILMEKELYLKRLENELGKGTAYDEGDEYDFE